MYLNQGVKVYILFAGFLYTSLWVERQADDGSDGYQDSTKISYFERLPKGRGSPRVQGEGGPREPKVCLGEKEAKKTEIAEKRKQRKQQGHHPPHKNPIIFQVPIFPSGFLAGKKSRGYDLLLGWPWKNVCKRVCNPGSRKPSMKLEP